MKKIITTFVVALLLVSCSKEANNKPVDDHRTVTVSDIDRSAIRSEARKFYSNFRTIVQSAGLGQRFVTSTRGFDRTIDTAGMDPISKELAMLDIEDANGNSISFFDLSEEEQDVFLSQYEILQSAAMSEKLALHPDAAIMLGKENEVIADAVQRYTIGTRFNTQITDFPGFLDYINSGISNLYQGIYDGFEVGSGNSGGNPGGTNDGNNGNGNPGGINDGGGIGDQPPTGTTNEEPNVEGRALDLVRALNRWGKRGDIMVTLPLGIIYIGETAGWNPNSPFPPGHTGIITVDNLPFTADSTTIFSIGAHNGVGYGVETENIKYWAQVPCFLMGLKHVKFLWYTLMLEKKEWALTYKEQPYLADWAEKYMGRPYVSPYAKVPFAKWYAPDEFICTTLIWWCANKAYDFVNISPWYATWVTPEHVYLDSSTFIKAIIE